MKHIGRNKRSINSVNDTQFNDSNLTMVSALVNPDDVYTDHRTNLKKPKIKKVIQLSPLASLKDSSDKRSIAMKKIMFN